MADGNGRSEGYVQLLIKSGLPLAVAAATATAAAVLFYVKKSSSIQSLDEEIDESSQNEMVLVFVDRIDEIEARFERYQSKKEQEMMNLKLQNMLELEMARGEYLEKEVSSIESEVRKMHDLEIYGKDLFQKVENLKSENLRMKKNVKKYYKKCKDGIRVNRAQKLMIRTLEATIKKIRNEVGKGTQILIKMDDEIHEFEALVNKLRTEKLELLNKFEVAEDALTLKHEECKKINNELEILKNEFATEGAQLVELRWTNAFLRRQLIQKDASEDISSESDGERTDQNQTLLQKELHYELEKIETECECSTSKPVEENHRSMSKANKGDVKSYGRHFSWDWVEEHVHGYGRKSFSSYRM